MTLLLSLSFAIMAGLAVSRFTKKLKLPHVTGYLIAGILIGPFCLGALGVGGVGFNTLAQIKELSLLSDLTLGFIAFAIGNEFRVSQIKAIGKQAAVIAVFQALLVTFTNKNLVQRGAWEGKTILLYWHQCVDMTEDTYERIPCGVYIVSEANHSAEGVVVVAYDYMSKLDKRVNFSALTSGKMSDYMRIIANRCGVTLVQTPEEIDSLGAGGEELALYQDSDISTYRDLLSWVAQTCGGFATFNRDGLLEIRTFGDDPVFEFTEYDRFAGCYFSDFETFYGGLSFIDLNTNTVVTRVEEQSGLLMSLGANPFLQNKLTPYQNYLLGAIFNELEDFHATPFRTTTLGNPAFDLGDIIEFTGRSAGESSLGCLMSYVCTFGHSYDMEGFGKNPTTQGAQSKTDKNISGLTRQSQANENVFLFLTNSTAFESQGVENFENGEFYLGHLLIGATKDTNVEAQTRATYKVTFNPDDTPPEFGAFRVWLRYELDSVTIKRVPFWR